MEDGSCCSFLILLFGCFLGLLRASSGFVVSPQTFANYRGERKHTLAACQSQRKEKSNISKGRKVCNFNNLFYLTYVQYVHQNECLYIVHVVYNTKNKGKVWLSKNRMYILSEIQVFLFFDLSWRVFKKSFIMSRVLSLLPTFSKRSTSLIADFILHLNSSQDGYSVSNVPRAASHVAKTTHYSSISLWSGWTLWPLCQKWHHCHLNTFLRGWCQFGGHGIFGNSW